MKIKFRIVAVILVVAMIVSTLASCGLLNVIEDVNGDGEKSVHGSTEDKVYKNEYFDLSLTIPAHWVFENKENLSDNPYFFFSDLTDEDKQSREFSLECRAVNPVTADAIEISVERLDSKYVFNGQWNFSNWSTGSGRFRNRPDYIETAGEIAGEIAGEQYNGWNYTITNDGNLAGRSAIFFKKVNGYIIAISILSDGYFGEDAPSNKNNAIGRMTTLKRLKSNLLSASCS